MPLDSNKAVLSWLRHVGLCVFMCAYMYVCVYECVCVYVYPNSALVT